jgi:hypothetical protein
MKYAIKVQLDPLPIRICEYSIMNFAFCLQFTYFKSKF